MTKRTEHKGQPEHTGYSSVMAELSQLISRGTSQLDGGELRRMAVLGGRLERIGRQLRVFGERVETHGRLVRTQSRAVLGDRGEALEIQSSGLD